MSFIKKRFEKNEIIQKKNTTDQKEISSCKEVLDSWLDACNINTSSNLRKPQLGALYAIKAHRTTSNEDTATVVMPTGTGKTETMIATVVSECIGKTLIVVPSRLLRDQTKEKFSTFGICKDLEIIKKEALYPIVACLKSVPKTDEELENIVDTANVVITTMSLLLRFNKEQFDILSSKINLLVVDEAHHVAANKWSTVKYALRTIPCLQFTATPFRHDGRKIDGKIIYNYPLSKAQEEGYFKKINFLPIKEYNDSKSDIKIAEKAIEQLKADLENGYKHIVLVRAKDKKSANRLYDEIYNNYYSEYNPVLIHSDQKKKYNDTCIRQLKDGSAKIVVCVDMFGEGIDIPNLKIAAIHDKYKSLPITLQFVGRIARTNSELGEATVITNIANEELAESINELYIQDSDWNKILSEKSGFAIDKEIQFQRFQEGFTESEIKELLKQLRPKVSTVVYKTNTSKWNINEFVKYFDKDNCFVTINEDKKVVIAIQKNEGNVEWTNYKGIFDYQWELHIAYWNVDMNMCFINSTNKGLSNIIANLLFYEPKLVKGEQVFKCLYGIKRLMLGTVGLKSNMNSIIRYKMFAGVDVAEGISESLKVDSIKSNLFGTGYNGSGRISIGCSYKGRIWSRWVESVDFWMNWCDDIAYKLSNDSIDTSQILNGSLVPVIITSLPTAVPYLIEWPVELDFELVDKVVVIYRNREFSIHDVDISIVDFDTNKINFTIGNELFSEDFSFCIDGNKYEFIKKSSYNTSIKIGKREQEIVKFFTDNPPLIKFADNSSLEGNLYVKCQTNPIMYDKNKIQSLDWTGVDIRKESQGDTKMSDSIQYHMINLLKQEDYSIIFDDDNSGEIADIICINDSVDDEITFKLFHCKFSSEDKPGKRINDLYEVCGQAEKSIRWIANKDSIIKHMKKREQSKLENKGRSRFEIGDLEKLQELQNKMKYFKCKFEIFIVQPGVDCKTISNEMLNIIGCTEAYLNDTYGVPLGVICS